MKGDEDRRGEGEGKAAANEPPAKTGDVLLVHGFSDGGGTAHVLRKRGETVESGLLRPVRSGQPLTGDLLSLRRRPEFPLLFDVMKEVRSPLRAAEKTCRGAGPSRTTSARYRKGWESVWGTLPEPDDALPN